MTEQIPYFVVISLGGLCLLLGFFIIVRGIGVSESEGSFKFLGIELRTSKVGPGILFSMFGVFLIVIAIVQMPPPTPTPTPTATLAPTPTPTPTPTSMPMQEASAKVAESPLPPTSHIGRRCS